MKKKFIGIIPARAGSQGIKNKNIKIIGNKPLIYWTIKEAKKSKMLSEVIFLTDSKKIRTIAKKYKIKVPFLRSKASSRNNSTMLELYNEIVTKYKDLSNFDAIVLLQPTSPLRNYKDIDNACKIFEKNNPDSLVSISLIKHSSNPDEAFIKKKNHLEYFDKKIKNNRVNKQDKKKYYQSNSAIYITKMSKVFNYILGGRIGFYEMPFARSLDIDYPDEFKIGDILLKYYKKKTKN